MSSMPELGIVVGVSGSQGSLRALRWAAAEAQRRHRPLRVVLAWEAMELAAYTPAAAHPDRELQLGAARETLQVALRSAFGTVMPQHVLAYVTEGKAERVLVEESARADLLVLGSGLRRSPSQACIGPVIRGSLGRAQCPVVVIGPLTPAIPEDAVAVSRPEAVRMASAPATLQLALYLRSAPSRRQSNDAWSQTAGRSAAARRGVGLAPRVGRGRVVGNGQDHKRKAEGPLPLRLKLSPDGCFRRRDMRSTGGRSLRWPCGSE